MKVETFLSFLSLSFSLSASKKKKLNIAYPTLYNIISSVISMHP